jgi:hypothetical protein
MSFLRGVFKWSPGSQVYPKSDPVQAAKLYWLGLMEKESSRGGRHCQHRTNRWQKTAKRQTNYWLGLTRADDVLPAGVFKWSPGSQVYPTSDPVQAAKLYWLGLPRADEGVIALAGENLMVWSDES